MDISGVNDFPLECKHEGALCKQIQCECWCDGCQEVFEALWEEQVVAGGCCKGCGMPAPPITIELLAKTAMLHFYSPCEDCKKEYEACMNGEGLCPTCRTAPYIDSEGAIECKCTAPQVPTPQK